MKEYPIIFSPVMVKAILSGDKTQTRRIVKRKQKDCQAQADDRGYRTTNVPFEDWHGAEVKSPYGGSGDKLWVRETWKPKYIKGRLEPFKLIYPKVHPWFYLADGDETKGYGSWKPSIHMPRVAARIILDVVDVRIERLQDITNADCLKEGIGRHVPVPGDGPTIYTNYEGKNAGVLYTPKASFLSLWESINGPDSWDLNPWVWVVEFSKINIAT